MNMRLLAIGSLITAAFVACAERKPETNLAPAAPVLKVAVSRTGAITVDGLSVTIDQLRDRFVAASKSGAVVWYYREDGQRPPPEQAMLVMKAIVDHGLPVSLSSTPDYSTVVLEDGTVRPR
jgi:hypothetical protein